MKEIEQCADNNYCHVTFILETFGTGEMKAR